MMRARRMLGADGVGADAGQARSGVLGCRASSVFVNSGLTCCSCTGRDEATRAG